jgi:competence ComEA-like helix-hairpin-helix protein
MQKKIGNMAQRLMWLAVLVLIVSMPLAADAANTQSKTQTTALIDLNTASEQDITSLKGVGPATAKKIIAARPYKSVDELSKAGLSAKKIEAIKPFVAVGLVPASAAPVPATLEKKAVPAPALAKQKAPKAPVTEYPVPKPAASTAKLAPGQVVNINTANAETLQALPGIGPAKAQAIIEGRPYNSKEDVMKVKGIKQGIFNKIKDTITVK